MRGGPPDPFRASPGVEPLKAPHGAHRGAEARTLHQAEPDVLEIVELAGAPEELHAGEVQEVDRREPAGEHPDGHRHGGDRGEHERGRENPRSHQVGMGADGQRLQRVHLLGNPHGPELRGDVGADPAGERHPGEHRAELQHHRLGHERTHEVERDGAGEHVGGEEREHDAGEDGDEERDRHRVDAELLHLGEELRTPGGEVGERAPGLHHPAAAQHDELAQRAAGRRGGAHAAKLASARPTSPSRSRLRARSRSCRTRSRVMPKSTPISSRVCSRPPSRPK